ncbi:MAG: restriction endonuclease subunit S [Methanobrevibacter sp.]|nr:restriction endonuclease subunit S [Candidatus Methanoflexus mossambicus]
MEKVKLGKYVKIENGYAFKSKNFVENGSPIIRITDLTNNNMNLNTCAKYTIEDFEKFEKYLVKEGDILIAMSGATTGKIGIVKGIEERIYLNQRIGNFKVLNDSKLNKTFLYYLVTSQDYQKKIKKIASGCAQQNISSKQLEGIEVNIPPLETQKQIVEVLERAEKLKKYREKADNLTEDYLKSIFLEMFGDVGKNPKKFDVVSIKDVVEKTSNENPKNEYPDEYFDYIDISSIDSSIGKITSSTQYLGNEASSRARQKIKTNDLLVSTVRPNLNAVGLVPEEFNNQIASTGFCVLRASEKISPEYLFLISRSNYFIESLINQCKGASYPAVNNGDVLNLKIPLPPLELQNKFAEIVKRVEEIKKYQKDSKNEIDNLFNNLMQKNFQWKD